MYPEKVYMLFAKSASIESRCSKRKLGCVIVCKDGTIIFGYNGAPEPLNKCETCPRIDSISGSNLNVCRAVHAERMCILKASRKGIKTEGSILYSYMGVPCKDCMLELIAAGVREIVCLHETYYDELSKDIVKEWREKGGILRFFNELI